ncbi:winged helix-turn-helix transcriptional regulator [Luedemannella flava]|uniref:Winged helix-turn-helix transcriptional regulator n=1 Tax=Luedemannella flava TaxID=349316 RepID=A0ABP4Y4P2_9ACTN
MGEAKVSEKRQYGQFCGLASAMDLIGERWTILIVRELLIGPGRFGDMIENLPGVSPNMLADRLRFLTEQGIIEVDKVPGDARGKLYRLTPLGAQLRPAIHVLARWGMNFLTEEDATRSASRAAWGFLAVQTMIDVGKPTGVDEEYEFRVDDEVFSVTVHDGAATAHRGPAANPALVLSADAETFIRVGAKLLSPIEAVLTGKITAEGDPEAVQRCTQLLGLDQLVRAA